MGLLQPEQTPVPDCRRLVEIIQNFVDIYTRRIGQLPPPEGGGLKEKY